MKPIKIALAVCGGMMLYDFINGLYAGMVREINALRNNKSGRTTFSEYSGKKRNAEAVDRKIGFGEN